MCGRYTMSRVDAIARAFPHFQLVTDGLPRWNVAPTDDVLAVRNDGRHEIVALRWGLVPNWARDPSIGSRLINARAETLVERQAFHDALVRRRALVLADGFYEWHRTPDGRKLPIHYALKSGEPFAFAGLWAHRERPHEPPIDSVTIVTTAANELVGRIHERMPVMLHPEDFERWLAPGDVAPELTLPLLRPFPAGEMSATPVSLRVNSVVHDDPACIAPLGEQVPPQQSGRTGPPRRAPGPPSPPPGSPLEFGFGDGVDGAGRQG
jgi:putative SOS response-associated peptidase YedK